MSLKPSPARESRDNQILLTARMLRDHYQPKRKKNLPDWILVLAVRDMLTILPGASPEELCDYLVARPRVAAHVSRFMAASLIAEATERSRTRSHEISVYTGARKFSFEKIAAMVTYITGKGQVTSRLKLNKLLFYGDFVNYFLHGRSISGAKYLRDTNGPETDRFDSILTALRYSGVVKVKEDDQGEEIIVPSDHGKAVNLSIIETVTMYWVLKNIGPLSPSEVCRYSQSESVHRFTRQGDYIAYEYAGLLQDLPERSMFGHALGARRRF